MENKKNSVSIRRKTVDAMLLVIILQILIIIGAIWASGVSNKLEDNGFKILSQTVTTRKNYIDVELQNAIMSVEDHIEEVEVAYEDTFKNKDPYNESNIAEFLKSRMNSMVKLLRDSGLTGAFIILNDDTKNTDTYSSIYVVDNDPIHNDIRNDSDVMVLKGPKEIFADSKIAAHTSWNYGITLEGEQKELFDMPYNAGLDYKDSKHLGYWYVGPDFYGENNKMIAYVKPIVTKNGKVVGVMGVEVGERHLYTLLPINEISSKVSSGYVLARVNEKNQLMPLIVQSSYLEKLFPYDKYVEIKSANQKEGGFTLKDNINIALVKEKITLYDHNSPYRYEDLYLVGVSDMSNIAEGSKELNHSIFVGITLALIVSIAAAFGIGRYITKSTKALMTGIENVQPGKEITLERTGIAELDALAESVEDLNKNALESVMKTDKIISMVDTDIGFFAFNFKENKVDVSQTLIEMLSLEKEKRSDGSISVDVMMFAIEKLKRNKTEDGIYKLISQNQIKWFKLESIATDSGEFGVVIDSTKDEIAKATLRRERDFDMLTGVYNRFAYHRILNNIMEKGEQKVAAFAMGDLDNLKHINDTYGHDTGDLYIKAIANYLRKYFSDKKALYARMSGDEFYIFVYGYDTKEEIKEILYGLNISIGDEYIDLPDGTKFKLRMSMGVAWYPEDSDNIDELSRMSDFAMYQGKHSIKGSIREFDKVAYENESYMFTGKEELVAILDNQLFDYAFQPIVSCDTGKIYGYEALIRPSGKTVDSPSKLINLAKIQGQLWKVEKNTFYTVLELSRKYSNYIGGSKIFLNSVPNQVLNEHEYEDLERNYKEVLSNIVVEITEGEEIDQSILEKKKKRIESWNSMIAIDDYGSGYSNESLIVNLKPDIIKIDRFLIDGIECNNDKYSLVRNLIDFAKANEVLVIAEGVETKEQLKTVVELGVDMVQGFYIQKPMSLPNFDNEKIKLELEEITKKITK